jgi:hypothetical protein
MNEVAFDTVCAASDPFHSARTEEPEQAFCEFVHKVTAAFRW